MPRDQGIDITAGQRISEFPVYTLDSADMQYMIIQKISKH